MKQMKSSKSIGIFILIVLSALSSCNFLPLSMEDFNTLAEQATPLELGSFHEAAFVDFTTHTYRCELEAGETYEINWKEKNNGLESDSADIMVSVQFNGETIYTALDDGYLVTRAYSAPSAGTLLISITPKSNDWNSSINLGSYAIRTKKVVRTSLVDGEWYGGESLEIYPQHFSFPVVAGELYELRMNDASSGDESKTGLIKVSGSLGDTTIFENSRGFYSTPKYFTASTNGLVHISVSSYISYSSYLGTWGIHIKKISPTTLQENEWSDGVSTYYSTHLFQIPLEAGETYEIHWNDRNNGDSTKTGQIEVSAQYGDTVVFADQINGYSTTRTISPESNGLLSIEVKAFQSIYYGNYLGSWAIRVKKVTTAILADGVWTDGESTDLSSHYFSIPLTAGEAYEINWNDAYNTSGGKTGKISVTVTYNGDSIYSNTTSGYSITRTFVPDTDGVLSIQVKAYSDYYSSYLGTWSLRVKKVVPVALSDNVWTDGESVDYKSHYFTIPVIAGEIYEINWNDAYYTNGGKTGRIIVTATCNGESVFTDQTSGYTTTRTCIPDTDGYLNLVVKVYNNSSSYFGTWAVHVKKVVPVTLTDNVWADGESVDFALHHFSMPVTTGEVYEINWQDSSSGDWTRTGRISVSASCNGTSLFTDQIGGYTTTRTCTPSTDGYLNIVVKTYNNSSSYLGTWAVRVKKVTPVTLIDNVWTDGESIDYSLHHFTIPVTAGEIYAINWQDSSSGDGTRTGRVKVSASCNGTSSFTDQTGGYTINRTIIPTGDGFLVITIKPYSTISNYLGTWAVRVKKVTPVTLTDNVWTDSSINVNEKQYYSFQATANTTYRIKWNDSYQGDGTKTCDIMVSAVMGTTTFFSNIDSGYTNGGTITPTENGTVILTVQPYSGQSGTYSIQVTEE